MWPTPTAEDSGSQMTTGLKVRTAYGQNMNGEPEKTENRGALNPEFIFWLMGFPEEWINSISEEMLLSYRSRKNLSKRILKVEKENIVE